MGGTGREREREREGGRGKQSTREEKRRWIGRGWEVRGEGERKEENMVWDVYIMICNNLHVSFMFVFMLRLT